MIRWCPILSESDMARNDNMMLLFKWYYWRSLTLNALEVEEPILTNNLAVPKKRRFP